MTIFAARVLSHCAHFHHWEIIIVVWTDSVFIHFNVRKNTMKRNYRAGILILMHLLGRLKCKFPWSFQCCPLDGQHLVPSPGEAPGLCQAMQSPTPKAQAALLFPGVEEVNTAGRNPSFQAGKKPMITTQCTSKSSWVVGEGGLRFSPGFVFWENRKKKKPRTVFFPPGQI